MKSLIKVFVTLTTLLTVAIPLTGCSPTISSEETEKELVEFMLDFIIAEAIGGDASYIETKGEPWVNPSSGTHLIIYSPPNEKVNKNPWEYLKNDEPINVWWYAENMLIEATDNKVAILKYQEYYMSGSNTTWPERFEFGILSISANNRRAIIYFSTSHCPECAAGLIHTIQKNDAGEWEITDSELLWLS